MVVERRPGRAMGNPGLALSKRISSFGNYRRDIIRADLRSFDGHSATERLVFKCASCNIGRRRAGPRLRRLPKRGDGHCRYGAQVCRVSEPSAMQSVPFTLPGGPPQPSARIAFVEPQWVPGYMLSVWRGNESKGNERRTPMAPMMAVPVPVASGRPAPAIVM